MRYVKVKDGKVVNATMFDGEMPDDWADKKGWYAHEDAQIGWSYNNGVFAAPPPEPPPPPRELTADELRRKTLREGADASAMIDRLKAATDAQVDAHIDGLPNTVAAMKAELKRVEKVLALLVRD